MGEVIHIEEWLEHKVNSRAQIFRKCVGTCVEKEMGDELRVLGHRLAAYKQFSMRKTKNGTTKVAKEKAAKARNG
jgi:hypothetical protein